LKPDRLHFRRIYIESPPARGRGLKHFGLEFFHAFDLVAPRTGAWIETCLR